MSQEHAPAPPLTRRDFLILALSGSAFAALAQAIPFGKEWISLKREDALVSQCNEYLASHPSLRQYTIESRPPLDSRTEPYQLITQNPSNGTQSVRLAFSEGEVPTLCIINQHGVCNYGELENLLNSPVIENLPDAPFVNEKSLKALQETFPTKNGDSQENILILGDSWTRWNGLEASYPAILQTLCDLSGKRVNIIDASATSLGVTDYRYHYERLKSEYAPSQVLYTYHPNTDARYDAPRANMGAEAQRASIGAVGGLRNPEPLKHAATNLFRTWETRNLNAYTTLKAIAKKALRRTPSDSLITPDELHEYLSQASRFTTALSKDGVKSHLLGLPVSDLGALDVPSYSAIWQEIATAHQSQGGATACNAHDGYLSAMFDEYTHPTLLGSLKLALHAYTQLFGKEPAFEVLENAFILHTNRRNVMHEIRTAIHTTI